MHTVQCFEKVVSIACVIRSSLKYCIVGFFVGANFRQNANYFHVLPSQFIHVFAFEPGVRVLFAASLACFIAMGLIELDRVLEGLKMTSSAVAK